MGRHEGVRREHQDQAARDDGYQFKAAVRAGIDRADAADRTWPSRHVTRLQVPVDMGGDCGQAVDIEVVLPVGFEVEMAEGDTLRIRPRPKPVLERLAEMQREEFRRGGRRSDFFLIPYADIDRLQAETRPMLATGASAEYLLNKARDAFVQDMLGGSVTYAGMPVFPGARYGMGVWG